MTIEFSIPMPLPSVANLREHWATKAARNKKQRQLVTGYFRGHVPLTPLQPPYRVTLTRQAKRRLDGDNLQTAFKAVRDAIAVVLDVDDGDERVTFEYAQRKGPTAICVRVEAAGDNP